MATAFPSLTAVPSPSGFSEGLAYDPTLRTQFDSGHVLTRTRHTQFPKRFTVPYPAINATDKGLLETLQTTVGVGGGDITWTHPITSASHTVRLDAPIEFKTLGVSTLWSCQLSLTEV